MSGKKNWKLNKTTRRVGSALLAVLMLVSVVAINAPSIRERGYAMSSVDNAEAEELDVNDENVSGGEGAEDSAEGAEDTAGADAEQAEENSEGAEDADSEDADGESAEDADDAKDIEDGESEDDHVLMAAGSQVLTAESGDYTVTVHYDDDAKLPEGASLRVNEITDSSRKYDEYAEQAKAAVAEQDESTVASDVTCLHVLDISILDENRQEVEPAQPVQVQIGYNQALETEKNGQVQVVHFAEQGTEILNSAAEVEDAQLDEVTFDTDSLSPYAIVYTVDFHYDVNGEDFTYSIQGGSVIGLKELLPIIGMVADDPETETDEVSAFVEHIEKVEFSDESLVKAAKVEENTTAGTLIEQLGLHVKYSADLSEDDIAAYKAKELNAVDWALISLKAFDSEETLTITMNNGDVFEVKVTDANYRKIAESDYVDVKKDGIVIKLFDYSGKVQHNNQMQNIDYVDGWRVSAESTWRNGTGINNNRTLLFSGAGLSGGSWYNNFTGEEGSMTDGSGTHTIYSGKAQQNIVKNTLSNGYPVLSDNIKDWRGNYPGSKDNEDRGSLGYLFGTGTANDGVTSYTGINGEGLTGLLQKNEDGYYYFNSEENYARYNDSKKKIELYNDSYQKANPSIMTNNIGFFPFDDYNPNKTNEKTPEAKANGYNHQFGMTVSGTFVYPPDGKLPDENGDPDDKKPMTFTFSGDDDVWVFIDNKLAIDLGGVHQPIKATINFATGDITYYEFEKDATPTDNSGPNGKNTSLWDLIPGFDKGDYSEHTFSFFYLERGGSDSNCRLEFNLLMPTTGENRGNLNFIKEDMEENLLDNAKFQLFKEEECKTPVVYKKQASDGTYTPAKAESTITTNSDGTTNVSFENIPVGIYYMREIQVPEGYFKNDTVYEVNIVNGGTSTIKKVGGSETITKIQNKPKVSVEVEKKWLDASGQNSVTPPSNAKVQGKLCMDYETEKVAFQEKPKVIVKIKYHYDGNGFTNSSVKPTKEITYKTYEVNYDGSFTIDFTETAHNNGANNNNCGVLSVEGMQADEVRTHKYYCYDDSTWGWHGITSAKYSLKNIKESQTVTIHMIGYLSTTYNQSTYQNEIDIPKSFASTLSCTVGSDGYSHTTSSQSGTIELANPFTLDSSKDWRKYWSMEDLEELIDSKHISGVDKSILVENKSLKFRVDETNVTNADDFVIGNIQPSEVQVDDNHTRMSFTMNNQKRKKITVTKEWTPNAEAAIDKDKVTVKGKLIQTATGINDTAATIRFEDNSGNIAGTPSSVTVSKSAGLVFRLENGNAGTPTGASKQPLGGELYAIHTIISPNVAFKALPSGGATTYTITPLEAVQGIHMETEFTLNQAGEWTTEWTVLVDPTWQEVQETVNSGKPFVIERSNVTYSYSLEETAVDETDGTETKHLLYRFKPSYEFSSNDNGYTGTITNEKQKLPTLKIYKNGIDQRLDNPNYPLANVAFLLERKVEGAEPATWEAIGPSEYGVGGNPRQTNAEGYVSFTELETGTYKLTEQPCAANAGYLVRGPWIVTVSEGQITMAMEGETTTMQPTITNATSDDAGDTYKYQIDNQIGYELPSAGGPGTYLFTISGVAMLFTALLLWIKPNRKEAWTEK